MKNILFVVFVFVCWTNAFSGDLDSFPYFNNTLNWNNFEKKISKKDRHEYALKIKDQFDFFFDQAKYLPDKYSFSNFEDRLHFIDLNADKKLDIIYEGFSGGESDFVCMLINKGNGFVKVIESYQYLEALDFDKSGRLISFTTLDFGCCAEYIEYETKFEVQPNFKTSIIAQRAKARYTIDPKMFMEMPVKFLTINDSYTLRSAPLVDDTSTIIYDAIGKGNVISIYPKKSNGIAWAQQTDSTGRVWWFVEMEPVKKLSYNLVFFKDSIPSKIVGWMSSRYLKKQE